MTDGNNKCGKAFLLKDINEHYKSDCSALIHITVDEKTYQLLWNQQCVHDFRAMAISTVQSKGRLTIIINGYTFDELPEAPAYRATLARAKTKINMNGPIKQASFPLIRNGELIPVTVHLNELTKFSKLKVGKQIVTSK